MFNMQRIGRKISNLRKEKNMTQMELADKLGISFQAVSNWERGNSMPDISKLPELAEVLEVSVDELLGEKSVIVDAVINNNMEEVITNEKATIEEISEALPVLKPEQVDTIIKQVDKSDSSILIRFLPYMNEDDVRDLALEIYKKGESIEGFLPFMCEDDVRDLALESLIKGENVEGFLPFMCEEDVRDLALENLKKGENVKGFLPFMCEDDVKDLALENLKKGESIEGFLPFMCEDDVRDLALENLIKGENVEGFLPFMCEDDVREMALMALKRTSSMD